MRVYSVHIRRHGGDVDRDLVLIKEGFSLWAALFNVLWALWHGLWIAALGLFVVGVALVLITSALGMDATTQAAVSVAFDLLVGFVGNDLRRWTLERRGYAEAGIVSAGNADGALQRFLDHRPDVAEELVG